MLRQYRQLLHKGEWTRSSNNSANPSFFTAAAFYAADRTASIAEGLELAAQMLDSGKAAAKLQELIDISNELEQAV